MNTEETIRKALISECQQRGKQAEISKTLDVHPSTVKRWIDGGEIPAPLLKLLNWYLFGEVPASLKRITDLKAVLDFDADEWALIGAASRREGVCEADWIAGRIRCYIRFKSADSGERVPGPVAVPDAEREASA